MQIQVMVTSREFLVMARHNLIPSWFAYVNPYTGTPLRVIIPFGLIKSASLLNTEVPSIRLPSSQLLLLLLLQLLPVVVPLLNFLSHHQTV